MTETVQQGDVTVRGDSLAASVTFNGSTVYTMTGNITNATYNDLNPTLPETEIFASVQATVVSEHSIIAMSPDGTGVRTLATLPASNFVPQEMSVSPAGTWLYYLQYTGAHTSLFRIPTAGGSPVQIIDDCASYALSPNGAQILFRLLSHDGWHTANADGSGSVLVSSNTTYPYVLGYVNDKLAWLSSASGNAVIAQLSITNGSVGTLNTNTGLYTDMGHTTFGHLPVWGFSNESAIWSIFGSSSSDLLQNCFQKSPAEIAIYHNGISPDPTGKSAVIAHYAGGPGPGITIVGQTFSMIANNFYSASAVAWGPFVKTRSFVGSGLYSTGAGAVLFSESGKTLPAIVLADAVTRTSCALTKISGDGNKNIAFRLDCDNLKKLHYSNMKNYALTKVIDTATGLKGAFISFDSDTGDIASVITFTKAPNARRTASGVHLEGGEMQTVYDRLGKSRPAAKTMDL